MKTIVAIKVYGKIRLWDFPVRIAAEDFINACLDMDKNLDYLITVEDENESTNRNGQPVKSLRKKPVSKSRTKKKGKK